MSNETPTTPSRKPRMSRDVMVATICGFVVALMVGASYAAVPFYNWFCKATGFAGTTQVATSAPTHITNRSVTVRFDSNIQGGLPWKYDAEGNVVVSSPPKETRDFVINGESREYVLEEAIIADFEKEGGGSVTIGYAVETCMEASPEQKADLIVIYREASGSQKAYTIPLSVIGGAIIAHHDLNKAVPHLRPGLELPGEPGQARHHGQGEHDQDAEQGARPHGSLPQVSGMRAWPRGCGAGSSGAGRLPRKEASARMSVSCSRLATRCMQSGAAARRSPVRQRVSCAAM